MDFDQYCAKWYTNNRILAYHDRLPPQRDIVSDFIRSLDPTNNLVFHTAALQVRQSSTLREDFDAAVDTFKNAIGDSPVANNKKRNVSEVSGGAPGGRETTDVKGRDYSKSTKKFIPNGEWRRMSPKQQDDFKKARAKRKKQSPSQSNQSNQSNGQSGQSRFDKRLRKALAAIAQEDKEKDRDNAGDQFGAQAHGGGSSNRRNGK